MNINKKDTVINSKNISLRKLNHQHAVGRWWEWFNDKEVTKNMNKGYEKNTPQKQLEFLKKMNNSKKDCVLGIFINENNQHIGTTAIHNITKDNNKKKVNSEL